MQKPLVPKSIAKLKNIQMNFEYSTARNYLRPKKKRIVSKKQELMIEKHDLIKTWANNFILEALEDDKEKVFEIIKMSEKIENVTH